MGATTMGMGASSTSAPHFSRSLSQPGRLGVSFFLHLDYHRENSIRCFGVDTWFNESRVEEA
jgi:hypothetical protein